MLERDDASPNGPHHSFEFWQIEYEPTGFVPPGLPIFAAADRIPFRLITHHDAVLIRPNQMARVSDGMVAVAECKQGELAVAGIDGRGGLYLLRSKATDPTSEQKHLLRDALGGLVGGSKTRIAEWSYVLSSERFLYATPRKRTNQRTRFIVAVINRDRFLLPRGVYYSHHQPPLEVSFPTGTARFKKT
jgi:hypothetical protein